MVNLSLFGHFLRFGTGYPKYKKSNQSNINLEKYNVFLIEVLLWFVCSFIDNYLYASIDTHHSHLRFCPNEMRPTATSLEATIGLLHSFKAVKWNRLTATEGSSWMSFTSTRHGSASLLVVKIIKFNDIDTTLN